MTIGLHWITKEGMPSSLLAGGSASHDEQLTADWKAIGGELTIDGLALLTSYRASGDDALFAWSVDGQSAGPHVIITGITRKASRQAHAAALRADDRGGNAAARAGVVVRRVSAGARGADARRAGD